MRLLLDTHIAVWAVTEDRQLSLDVLRLIEDARCYVSLAAIWEIAIKNALGARTSNAMPFGVSDALTEFGAAGFELIRIEASHIQGVETLPLHHRDPFDRLMIAQATIGGMRLATRDRRLPAYGDAVLAI